MRLSPASIKKLETCDPDLQKVIQDVSDYFNIAVSCGHRGQEEQDDAYLHGKSQVKWPNSKHNSSPSVAVDIAPLDYKGQCIWTDTKLYGYLAGYVIATGLKYGLVITWGGDWNRDGQVSDNKFHDLPHFEIKEKLK